VQTVKEEAPIQNELKKQELSMINKCYMARVLLKEQNKEK